MKLLPAAAMTFAALSLLAACSPKGGGNAASGGAGSPAAGGATSGPDVEVKMSDFPRPRAGLWKIVMDSGEGKPNTFTSCHSGKQPEIPKMPKGCDQLSIKRKFLGGYVMDMACKTPEYSMNMHATVTGDFQTHASGDSVTTMSMGGKPPQTMKMHTDETWVGPCAPGQKPDDAGETSGG
ncbi:MAG TPA: DUF3617 family protein [Caulobacteraceae bacterium]|jgi:hypothetical protein|nr:DUF3617 family protein [Caulobacteraceae bacterium]